MFDFIRGMENRKLISATDTQYSGTLLASLNEQRIHGLYCDVTVVVEYQTFRAHKNILSASSTYFHDLLSHAGQVVELSFVRAEMFAEILNYIYTSKIVRVRSDLLEELIKSGQLLGVKFIADLGVPLSQVKSLGSSSVKSNNADTFVSDWNQKVIDVKKTSSDMLNKDCDMDAVSVIPETTEISSNKLQESKKAAGLKEMGKRSDHDDDDDDVIFCSEVIPPKPSVSNYTEMEQQKACTDVKLSSQQTTFNNTILHTQFVAKAKSPNNLLLKDTNSSSVNIQSLSQIHSRGAFFGPAQKHLPNQVTLSSSNIGSVPPRHLSPTNDRLLKPIESSNTFSSNPLIISDGTYASSTNFLPGSQISQSNIKKSTACDVPKHKNTQKSTFSRETISKLGELKIKASEVTTGGKVAGSQHITDGKKIITLDTPSKIEELSTGCKVYENIGEDTFDIVIPIKGEADDDDDDGDDDGAVVLPRSIDGSPNSKRMKLKHEDHYELNVDGKAYYICIVCKRSYLSVTTLKRHYNCHSWEKKYPCHYCEKVFPMAEYRTKHEILHTGERRYECLTCGDSFINYQITISHLKSAHGKDPSGNGKLYRLHPSRTVSIRPYNYAADAQPSSSASSIIKDEMVYNVDGDDDKKEGTASEGLEASPTSNHMSWDDVFVKEKNRVLSKLSSSEGSPEFEFVIPESY